MNDDRRRTLAGDMQNLKSAMAHLVDELVENRGDFLLIFAMLAMLMGLLVTWFDLY